MCETKDCTQLIVASKLKPSECGTLPSAASATVETDDILGKENAAIIAQPLYELRKLEKNAENATDLVEAHRRLRVFVHSDKMRTKLGINKILFNRSHSPTKTRI